MANPTPRRNSLEWNLQQWNHDHSWARAGEEWSEWWGTAEMQWYRYLFPRLRAFVPTRTILEIAPGFGRWTHYLKDLCDTLHVVDLSPKCIDECRKRFADSSHIAFHVNDGRSLPMVPDHSVDFVFTFDSLVHVEAAVIEAYAKGIAAKLTPDGVAFIHHSNLAEYGKYHNFVKLVRRASGGRLIDHGWVDAIDAGFRAPDVSGDLVIRVAGAADMQCVSQERFPWMTRRMTDAISVLTPQGSRWARPTRVLENADFNSEVDTTRRLSDLYARHSFFAK